MLLTRIVDKVARTDGPRVLAGLIRLTGGDFDAAEDALQEAYARALVVWRRDGLPAQPGAWINTVSRRLVVDALRREATRRKRCTSLDDDVADATAIDRTGADVGPGLDDASGIEDDRLRLLFVCCHPALAPEAQRTLALRTLGGLTTREIARAFVEPEPTTAQRLVRAKRKIREARIAYEVPPRDRLRERIDVVLSVLYLIFNEGYAATDAPSLVRPDLMAEAIRLARLAVELLPDSTEPRGLLALMLLTDARRPARLTADGALVPLEEQDRSRWQHGQIDEGVALLDDALARGAPGPYQIQAAIAALHARRDRGRDRLATDRRALPGPAAAPADADRRAERCRGAGPGHRCRSCAGMDGAARTASGPRQLPSAARVAGGSAAPSGAIRGGVPCLPPGADARHESGGAALPGPAPGRVRGGRDGCVTTPLPGPFLAGLLHLRVGVLFDLAPVRIPDNGPVFLRSASRLGRRAFRAVRRLPLAGRLIVGTVALVIVWAAANGVVQVIRKPAEVFAVGGSFAKVPAETWREYGALFDAHSTAVITPELLAALAQVESSGDPVARTYWRWRLSWNPFELYRPASSAVGMLQITDGTFTEARRYCIHDNVVVEDGPWHDMDACWFNALYTRVVPGHAVEMTAALLNRSVARTLARHGATNATPQQRQDLAAIIHLCGGGAGDGYARRGFRFAGGQRCGDHNPRHYLARVNTLKRHFARLAAAD